MKKERFYKLVIVLLLLINAGTLAWLWLGGDSKGPREGAVEYLAGQLNLDAAQRRQIEALREEHHQGNMEIRNRNKQLHDDFFDALKTSDSTQVESLADSMAALHKKQELLTWYHFKKIREVCNAGQKKKFDELIKETMRRMAPPPPGHLGPPHEGR
jgi:Spy/CpxP family protein refolding chaperone